MLNIQNIIDTEFWTEIESYHRFWIKLEDKDEREKEAANTKNTCLGLASDRS